MICFRADLSAFKQCGFLERELFPHWVVHVRKPYPDTFLAMRRRGMPEEVVEQGVAVQINVYSDAAREFPVELLRHPMLNWHGQQLGIDGLVAAAGVFLPTSDDACISWVQSDLLQQLYRHSRFREYKTQLEKRFRYWYRIAFNAAFDFARRLGCRRVLCPSATHVIGSTRRRIEPALFSRIYDTPPRHYHCHEVRQWSADWWSVEVADNTARIAALEPVRRPLPAKRIICISHDIEQDVDTDISREACRGYLDRMLEVERKRDVAATYNILGQLFDSTAPAIRSAGAHAIGFHSFDHQIEVQGQLEKVRRVDLQVKGYRPPQSVITEELTAYRLAYLNFEWLASSASSLGQRHCELDRGVAKIPIAFDDWSLQSRQLDYRAWKQRLVALARRTEFLAFGLHDCYAGHWIDDYDALLAELSSIGELWSFDQVAARLFLESTEVAC